MICAAHELVKEIRPAALAWQPTGSAGLWRL